MYDARGNLHVFDAGEVFFRFDQCLEQTLDRKNATLVMDLERANAGREVEEAGRVVFREPLHERVDAEAEIEIEDKRTVFNE
jgi:hypothetical protein